MCDANALRFTEIIDVRDDLLEDWLDLYQCSFEEAEQILVSELLRMLKQRPGNQKMHLLAALQDGGELVGLALYRSLAQVGWLWYLAVRQDRRGQGVGAAIYSEVLGRCRNERPDIKAIVLEIERPDQSTTEEKRRNAERRIAFYRRLGVRVATNIRYWMSVGEWQPPRLYFLAIHSLQSMADSDALQLLRDVFKEHMEPVTELVLD